MAEKTITLSKQTIEVLENFALVNSAVLIKKGNRIVTMANSGGVLANAEVPDTFNTQFGVYDLRTFLSLIGLVGDNAHLTTGGGTAYVTIQNAVDKPTIKYKFYVADESLLTLPPKDELVFADAGALQFELDTQSVKKILQATSVLGLDHIALVSDGSGLYLQTSDPKVKDKDSFSILLNSSTEAPAQKFNMIFSKEKFTLLPGKYMCSLRLNPNVWEFKHADRDLRYWIAAESKSTVDGE